MPRKRRKLYSVWANDKYDTLIAIDLPAERCAWIMNVSVSTFRTYIFREKRKWTIMETGKEARPTK